MSINTLCIYVYIVIILQGNKRYCFHKAINVFTINFILRLLIYAYLLRDIIIKQCMIINSIQLDQ